MSLSESVGTKSEKPMSFIWGESLLHPYICLGEKARDEFHVVEVVPADEDAVPLATLKPSVLPMATLVGVELTPPVTFRLRAGSGPVYISGQHVSLVPDLSWEEEEEEEEEEVEEEEEETPEVPPPRGQVAKKGHAAKVP
ncbi:nucleoplasmin-like [Phasianus colchicus]|uniref:nucleoplasmin-like n=1 Tax=Phasianus colchicus TaxID=9054 RepID=UPI00129DE984|nr:nucleoplasmin-like [Phasianus colchicus]